MICICFEDSLNVKVLLLTFLMILNQVQSGFYFMNYKLGLCVNQFPLLPLILFLGKIDAPKEVKASKNRQTIKEGDNVTLTCSAKGQPKVTYSWFKDGTRIQEGQLQFASIKESDNGLYRCQAKNKVGTDQSSELKMNVLCEYFLIKIHLIFHYFFIYNK